MMARFCAYAEKVFGLSERFPTLTDSRARPRIKTAAAFAGAFTLFATRRGSLNGLEQDLRIPARLQGLVGAGPPSVDSIGRIYALMSSQPLRRLLRNIAHRLKRNKALTDREGYLLAAVDGHELFASRKRCCPACQTRTLTIKGEPVTEYYHQAVVCQLIGQELALVLDVELLRPGEGEETAAKRLLERVFADYPRFFDIVVADALYFDAPFINFCRDRHKHVIVTAKGDNRLLIQDAAGLFANRSPAAGSTARGRCVGPCGTGMRRGSRRARGSRVRCGCCAPRRRWGGESGSPRSGWRRRRRRSGRGRRR